MERKIFSAARLAIIALAPALLNLANIAGLPGSEALAAEDPTFAMGQNLYNSGDYKSALNYLKACSKQMAYDPRPLYFQAACEYRLGHYQQAASLYSQVVGKYPGSDAAELSKKALAAMGMGYAAAKSGGSLGNMEALHTDQVPDSQTLPCKILDGKPVVAVSVGGVKVDMQVDTSRADTVIGAHFMRDHHLPDVPTQAKPTVEKPAKAKAAANSGPNSAPNSAPKTSGTKVNPAVKAEASDSAKSAPAPAKDAAAGAESAPAAGKDAAPEATKEAAKDQPKDKEKAAEYALYEIDLGKMKRTSFPVFIDPKNVDIAVLGSDFFDYTTVSFDPKKSTLAVVRNASFKDPFAAGMKFFNQRNYSQALTLLKKASLDHPADSRPLYAQALCFHRMGKTAEAMALYRKVVQRYPNSEAQLLSTSALIAMDPTYSSDGLPALNKGKIHGIRLVDQNLPEFDVPYKAENGQMRVTAQIDGKNVDCYFVGSGSLTLGSDQIRDIDATYLDQASEPNLVEANPDNSNILTRTSTRTVLIRSVRLGPLQASNYPCTIYDVVNRFGGYWPSSSLPSLGADLARGWRWEANPSRRVIHFLKTQ